MADSDPLTLVTVLREEYAALRPEWFPRGDGETSEARTEISLPDEVLKLPDAERPLAELFQLAHHPPDKKPLSALCLSGGGIRSATFNLGVLQGLAARGVLPHFDYLSSVSGGGYIASWLSGWIRRTKGGLAAILPDLAGHRKRPLQPEAAPIVHLRAYSNYLTPRVGGLSLDGWTVGVIFLRNLLLNWLVLVPVFAAVLALPLLAIAYIEPPSAFVREILFRLGLFFEGIGLMFMFALRGIASRELPVQGEGADRPPKRREHFVLLGLLPVLIATALLTTAASWADPRDPVLLASALIGVVVPAMAFAVSVPLQAYLGYGPCAVASDLAALVVSGAITATLYAFLFAHATAILSPVPHGWAMLGPGLLLAPFMLGNALFVAFASWAEGRTRKSEYGDAQREWWARWCAWVAIAAVTWTAGSALVYLTPCALAFAYGALATAIGTLTLGRIISLIGTSALTPARNGKGSATWTQWAITLGVPVFCILLAMLISYATQAVVGILLGNRIGTEALIAPPAVIATVIGVLALVGLVLGSFVNVNRFSLHALYRNRLVRAYLGASNPKREPNFFTGFDPGDNLRLAELRANRPLPVINMALNLVRGENLAWQQRKAESFTATPLHCGSADLGYRPTAEYGGRMGGMTIGTAVAISGAAANPNMGYNSSPAVTLVMSFFNARLGAWLGNPGRNGGRSYMKGGPRLSSIYYMLAEAFGWTDCRRAYVDLSDGGHFDNLGLYEMVRRRCRFILVSDAGQDKACQFGDLGNAIRKIRVDFGISIEFTKQIRIFPKVENSKDLDPRAGYCAIGQIRYGDVDPGAPTGTLLYIKPAIVDAESYDIYNYARTSSDFPHETTADQWFSESQFESYRALGKTTLLAISEALAQQPPAADLLQRLEVAADGYLIAREGSKSQEPQPAGESRPENPEPPPADGLPKMAFVVEQHGRIDGSSASGNSTGPGPAQPT